MIFLTGLVVGVALGTIVVAFLALGSYERGYEAASGAPWRLELQSRRAHAGHVRSVAA